MSPRGCIGFLHLGTPPDSQGGIQQKRSHVSGRGEGKSNHLYICSEHSPQHFLSKGPTLPEPVDQGRRAVNQLQLPIAFLSQLKGEERDKEKQELLQVTAQRLGHPKGLAFNHKVIECFLPDTSPPPQQGSRKMTADHNPRS